MKVPCTACGAMILPTTARATGGVCMACKAGIRKNLDAAKAYYAKQREPDPIRDYWRDLVQRVHKMPQGLSDLSSAEQIYFAVGVFEGEVYNGGVHQFFFNSSGDHYSAVVAGLEALGAHHSLRLLLLAREALFPTCEPPGDTTTRRQYLPWWPEDRNAPTPAWSFEIERIDKELWTDPDKLTERLQEFATRHNLIPDANKPTQRKTM